MQFPFRINQPACIHGDSAGVVRIRGQVINPSPKVPQESGKYDCTSICCLVAQGMFWYVTNIKIPIIKTRRSQHRLNFIKGISVPRKLVLILKLGPVYVSEDRTCSKRISKAPCGYVYKVFVNGHNDIRLMITSLSEKVWIIVIGSVKSLFTLLR